MMSKVLRTALKAASLGSLVALASCNGVGEGIAPVSAVLLPTGGAEGDATMKAYTCLNSSLALIVDFSNGARGDFTSRATWSSSNRAVVKVSNGAEPVPDETDLVYGKGVIIPVAAGSAVITVRYLDFQKSITVNIADPTNFKITPAEANLAIGANLDLSLTADVDGVSTSVDGFARWAFNAPTPAETVATINAFSGLVSSAQKGTSTAGSFGVSARIPGCALKGKYGLDADGKISVSGAVSKLASLQLTKEFPGTDRLVVGTTERFTVTGTLENGKTQDLTGSTVFTALKPADGDPTTDDENVASDLALFLVGSTRNLLLASKAGSGDATEADVSASFSFREPDSSATSGEKITVVRSNVIPVVPVAPTLSSIAISSSSTRLAPGNRLQLTATGTYAVDASTSLQQDITRHVTWKPSLTTDTGIETLVVQTSGSAVNPLAGLAVASTQAENGKEITVEASKAVSDTDTKSATLKITIDPDEPQETR